MTYPPIAEISARLQALPEHHIFRSYGPPNSSGGAPRFRAFCRCGFVGEATDSLQAYKSGIRDHLAGNAEGSR